MHTVYSSDSGNAIISRHAVMLARKTVPASFFAGYLLEFSDWVHTRFWVSRRQACSCCRTLSQRVVCHGHHISTTTRYHTIFRQTWSVHAGQVCKAWYIVTFCQQYLHVLTLVFLSSVVSTYARWQTHLWQGPLVHPSQKHQFSYIVSSVVTDINLGIIDIGATTGSTHAFVISYLASIYKQFCFIPQ